MSEHGLRARLQLSVGRMRLDVELHTAAGEALVVVGPNGAGKSSLLLALLGARPVTAGRVTVGEQVLLDTAASIDLPVEARRLGYVPQDYALFGHLSVRDNVGFALDCAAASLAGAERVARTERLLQQLGLAELAERRPRQLSGGERQRVALARALAAEPRALLLDEPLAALDVHARRQVRELLAAHLAELGLPTVIVTHDPDDARRLGGRIVVLEDGAIRQTGSWDELTRAPATRFVEELVAAARAR